MRSGGSKKKGLHAHLSEVARPWVHKRHEHPAMQGVFDGTLDTAVMRHWLEQDSQYLQVYARTFARLAAMGPDRHLVTLIDGAHYTLHTEVDRLTELAELFGADLGRVPMGDACRRYTEHLESRGADFAEGVVAVLPCMMGFAAMGLAPELPTEVRYRRWIEIYASGDFQGYTARFAAVVDDLEIELEVATEILEAGLGLEIAMWDEAYKVGKASARLSR